MAPGKTNAVLCSGGVRVAHSVYVADRATPAYNASPVPKVTTDLGLELGLGLGLVDRTDPASGAQVARGSVITLRTSESPVTL